MDRAVQEQEVDTTGNCENSPQNLPTGPIESDKDCNEKAEKTDKLVKKPKSKYSNPEFDRIVKDVLIKKLFILPLKGASLMCPLCRKVLQKTSTHFDNHSEIFRRGCIICDTPLNVCNICIYYIHLEEYHQKELDSWK